MATLTPVDFDPFASAPAPAASASPQGVGSDGVLRLTVTPRGREPKLTPVDYDPFAPAEKPSVMTDVAASIPSGLARGAAALIGLPDLIADTGAEGIDRASRFVADKLGLDYERPKPLTNTRLLPSTKQVTSAIESVAGPLYEPRTTAGKFARTAAEFVPGAVLAPGGIAANAVRYGVIPGLASEAAGQLTEGSSMEPVARVAGALTGAGVAALAARPGSAAQAIRQQLPEGITQGMVDDAASLIERAAQQGVNLAWPEALSQVAGRPVLTNVMRHLEAAPQTEARMAEFFGQRPQQVEHAGRNTFNNLAPTNLNPSGIGPAIGEAAEGIATDVRGAINRASEPFYNAAAPQRMDPATMAQIRATPGWEEASAAVRNDPQLNRHVANLPDDSIGFLNEVKKYLDQAGENAAAPVNQARNMQRSAGYGQDAEDVRNAATRQSSDYAYALEFQRRAREQFLDPLLRGPIGKLADRDITTRNAINALFPQNPVANSADEIGQAVGALAHRSPRVAADLVRAHVESVFNEATQALQTGANQAGGAKFAAQLVGNSQQRANLEAAIRALPNGDQRLAGFNRFLEITQATGTRQGIGSRTAYNAEALKNQAASGLAGESAKAIANPLRGAQFLADKYERWRLGRNLNELATILTSPQSANQLRAIARMHPGSRQAAITAARIANIANTSTNTPRVSGPRQ